MLKHLLLIILLFVTSASFAQNEADSSYNEDAEYYEEEATDEVTVDEEDYYEKVTIDFRPVTDSIAFKERSISDKEWQKLTNDPIFDYIPREKVQPSEPSTFWLKIVDALARIADFFVGGVGQVILWVLLAIAIIFIVFRITKLKGNLFFSKKDKKLKNADEYADDYVPEDWDATIQDAVRQGNYRLAVRHTYRYLLLLLSENEHIKYQQAKTNYQYGYELMGTPYHQPFMQMTRRYDYAWYGGFEIQQAQFEEYFNLFKDVKGRL